MRGTQFFSAFREPRPQDSVCFAGRASRPPSPPPLGSPSLRALVPTTPGLATLALALALAPLRHPPFPRPFCSVECSPSRLRGGTDFGTQLSGIGQNHGIGREDRSSRRSGDHLTSHQQGGIGPPPIIRSRRSSRRRIGRRWWLWPQFGNKPQNLLEHLVHYCSLSSASTNSARRPQTDAH
jgi:hypothetical protein